tara:strand:- start:725 stop:943 length:219 start_codon:yes stop_codon:yes gene_type:complete
MSYKKEENGHFVNGDPAFLIWNGEELVAGPMREKEADAMLKELKPTAKKAPAKKAPAKKSTTKKVKKNGKKK